MPNKQQGALTLLQTPTVKITPTSVVVLAPTENFQACLKSMMMRTKMLAESKKDSIFSPDTLRRNSIACLLPYTIDQAATMPEIKSHWQEMVDGELSLWCESEKFFPKQRDFEQAQGWFQYELHPVVYALLDRDDLLHTQAVMLLLVRPKPAFIEWLNQNKAHLTLSPESNIKFEQSVLETYAPGYLVPRLSSRRELDQYLSFYARAIFANECSLWCSDEKYWPRERDAMSFDRYFSIEPHTNLLDFTSH